MHSIDPAPRTRPRWRMRSLLIAMAALAVVALSACGGGEIPADAWDTAAATPAAGDPAAGTPAAGDPAAGDPAVGAPATGDPPAVIRLDKQGRAKQDGVARFMPQGDQTEVDVRAIPYNLGRTQPVTIDSVECGDVDELDHETVDWELELMMDGFLMSPSVLDVPIGEILNGERTIHIRQEPNLAFVANGCGVLPSDYKTVTMGVVGDSDQAGFATLVSAGAETHVNIWVDVLPEWRTQFSGDAVAKQQPANIYAGTCDALGAVVHPLGDVFARNGWGSTVVPAGFNDLAGGAFALALLRSADDNSVTSCANLDGSSDS